MKFASGTHLQQAFGERGIDVERTEQWYGEHIETEGVAVVDGLAVAGAVMCGLPVVVAVADGLAAVADPHKSGRLSTSKNELD